MKRTCTRLAHFAFWNNFDSTCNGVGFSCMMKHVAHIPGRIALKRRRTDQFDIHDRYIPQASSLSHLSGGVGLSNNIKVHTLL